MKTLEEAMRCLEMTEDENQRLLNYANVEATCRDILACDDVHEFVNASFEMFCVAHHEQLKHKDPQVLVRALAGFGLSMFAAGARVGIEMERPIQEATG